MKRNFLKTGAFFSLVALTLSSCLKDDLQELEIGIDPSPWYSYSAYWQETERKIGTAEWQTIPNGNLLNLWWETDTSKTIHSGKYEYNQSNARIGIDTVGGMQIKDGLLSFVAVKTGGGLDTIAKVAYLIYGDTLLVLRNTSSVPVTEIRYKKIK